MCVRELRKIVIDESKSVLVSQGDPRITHADKALAELLGPNVAIDIRPADRHDIAIARTSFKILRSKAGIDGGERRAMFDPENIRY